MKKNGVWEVVLRIFIAAATAALTALGMNTKRQSKPEDDTNRKL